jgi:rubrerythrin
MTKRTKDNLSIGMHGEAFASAKYKRFAAFARSKQNNKLAVLFTEAADESRIGHFAREMEVAGLLSDDLGNLEDVIRDKLYHTERYTQFAQEAEQDGDADAAALFRGLASDDEGHVRELETALAQCQQTTISAK